MKFIKVDIEQEGDAWHAFRADGLGGTDAGILLGLNPYESVDSIYSAKALNTSTKEFSDHGIAAMEHGKSLEDTARQTFSKIIGMEFNPTCAIHKDFSFIRSSLDGISNDYTTLLEIKCPFRQQSFSKHLNGILPYYYAQAQHQMLTTGAELLYFGSYFKDDSNLEVVIYKVLPDIPLQTELTKRCQSIWKSITAKKPPSQFGFYEYNLRDPKYQQFYRKKLI